MPHRLTSATSTYLSVDLSIYLLLHLHTYTQTYLRVYLPSLVPLCRMLFTSTHWCASVALEIYLKCSNSYTLTLIIPTQAYIYRCTFVFVVQRLRATDTKNSLNFSPNSAANSFTHFLYYFSFVCLRISPRPQQQCSIVPSVSVDCCRGSWLLTDVCLRRLPVWLVDWVTDWLTSCAVAAARTVVAWRDDFVSSLDNFSFSVVRSAVSHLFHFFCCSFLFILLYYLL